MLPPIPAWMPGASLGFPDAVAVTSSPSDTHLASGELLGKGLKAKEGTNPCRHPGIRGGDWNPQPGWSRAESITPWLSQALEPPAQGAKVGAGLRAPSPSFMVPCAHKGLEHPEGAQGQVRIRYQSSTG